MELAGQTQACTKLLGAYRDASPSWTAGTEPAAGAGTVAYAAGGIVAFERLGLLGEEGRCLRKGHYLLEFLEEGTRL